MFVGETDQRLLCSVFMVILGKIGRGVGDTIQLYNL